MKTAVNLNLFYFLVDMNDGKVPLGPIQQLVDQTLPNFDPHPPLADKNGHFTNYQPSLPFVTDPPTHIQPTLLVHLLTY
jgi:hypothetical protein